MQENFKSKEIKYISIGIYRTRIGQEVSVNKFYLMKKSVTNTVKIFSFNLFLSDKGELFASYTALTE